MGVPIVDGEVERNDVCRSCWLSSDQGHAASLKKPVGKRLMLTESGHGRTSVPMSAVSHRELFVMHATLSG